MPLGYLGYARVGPPGPLGADSIYLLTNSSGLNRQVNPILSTGVWGAGWWNAATTTNYADYQQHFEGDLNFDLQAGVGGQNAVWNQVSDWLVEQRVFPRSLELSPNGTTVFTYEADLAGDDARAGAWMSAASFTVDPEAIVTVGATLIALVRSETYNTFGTYKADLKGPNEGGGNDLPGGIPTAPLNPAPINRNPIPGWNARATLNFPTPSIPLVNWTPATQDGFVLMNASINQNNNTQIIRGATGDANPVAVLQGTITVDGSLTLWRDGPIQDPYGTVPGDTNRAFTVSASSLVLEMGVFQAVPLQFEVLQPLLTSDAFDIQAQNTPTSRVFGLNGLGDGIYPPLRLLPA